MFKTIATVCSLFCCLGLSRLVNSQEPLQIGELPEDREVSFSGDILPIFRQNCIACHNSTKAESGVNLESIEAMRSSDIEETLVPGDARASYLFQLAAHLEEPVMPPEENDVSAKPLTSEELALLQRWIQRGAKDDQPMSAPNQGEWRQLPSRVKTAFAAAMTEDGRLSAVSLANQVRVFGARGPTVLERLTIAKDGQDHSPHVDFVHAIAFARQGDLIFSAGYRNVRVWKRASPDSITTPSIGENVAGMTLSPNGAYLASFSPVGEIAVAKVGEPRWSWLRGFEVDLNEADESATPVLVVNDQGNFAGLAYGESLYLVPAAGETVRQELQAPATALQSYDDQSLLVGHQDGAISLWRVVEGQWKSETIHQGKEPVKSLLRFSTGGFVALTQSGHYVQFDSKVDTSADKKASVVSEGKLPAGFESAAAMEDGGLFVATPAGAIGRFDLEAKQWTEFSKLDPALVAEHAAAEWSRMVGERIVSTLQSEEKKIRANQEAEKKSLEKNQVDLAARLKTQQEQASRAEDMSDMLASARETLAAKQLARNQLKTKRSSLEEELAAVDQEIEKRAAELEQLKQQREAKQKELTELPAPKALDSEVAKAETSVQAGEKVLDSASQALALTKKAVQQLEQANGRIEARIAAIEAELAEYADLLETAQSQQAKRQAREQELLKQRDSSRAVVNSVFSSAIAGSDATVLTTSGEGVLHLWTASGDWLPWNVPMPPGTTVEAVGANHLLFMDATGGRSLLRLPAKRWQLSQTLGSPRGESRFADRVLALAVSPNGKRLATGGGAPSRSGELILWDVPSDGKITHAQTLDAPHQDTVLSLSFSPDGSTLASSSADRMIKLWDAKTGDLLKTLEGHTHHVTAIAWSVTGRQLYSASADKTIKIWDVESAKATRTIQGLKSEITNLVDVGRDKRVGVITGDGYFRIYRADNGARETNQKLGDGYLYGLGRNRQGTEFIVSGVAGFAQRIDRDGKPQVEFPSD